MIVKSLGESVLKGCCVVVRLALLPQSLTQWRALTLENSEFIANEMAVLMRSPY